MSIEHLRSYKQDQFLSPKKISNKMDPNDLFQLKNRNVIGLQQELMYSS
jgi:hypothetical protein